MAMPKRSNVLLSIIVVGLLLAPTVSVVGSEVVPSVSTIKSNISERAVSLYNSIFGESDELKTLEERFNELQDKYNTLSNELNTLKESIGTYLRDQLVVIKKDCTTEITNQIQEGLIGVENRLNNNINLIGSQVTEDGNKVFDMDVKVNELGKKVEDIDNKLGVHTTFHTFRGA